MLNRAEARRSGRLGWWALVRREREIAILMIAVAFCVLLFWRIAVFVEQGRANAFDLCVLHALRPAGAPHDTLAWAWSNIGASDISAMGSDSMLAFIVVLTAGLFLGLKHWREATLLFLALVGGLIITAALQSLIDRPRPPLTPAEAAGLGASFPSGHPLISATVYLTLAALIGHFTRRRFVRLYALGTAVVLTVIIGLSRVFLGMHWCTDVLAGWCIGLASALSWRVIDLVWERLSLRTGAEPCNEEPATPDTAPAGPA